ncbi:MAG: hypothetical protein PQJ61_05390 [Spirochaetales bacterium]|uniref:Uncharacterized protein n=1 Tax=Candidatus Thalassospirochaeta sargassi TaxID=3119039 RepID=A0AAJ1IBG7_9SPIO|nr:hypothetical protein [Spirochaetales bacterium]
MKKLYLLTLLILLSVNVYAFDASAEVELSYDIDAQNPFYQTGIIDVGHTTDYIDFFWSFSVCNDDKYAPSHSDDLFFGYYFFLEEGGFTVDYEDLSLTLGRTTSSDDVDSPYSLFVSSKIIPALQADFNYDDGRFFFTSRWTELNRDSSLYTVDSTLSVVIEDEDEDEDEESVSVTVKDADSLDRGWQYNSYGVYIGDWRLGFQDSMVYTDSSFDPEYFFNPLPGFFKQYVRISSGKPWTSSSNANSIMGFFVEWTPEDVYSYGQLLIDDFNANAIFNPDSYQNPNKIAWSLGGRYDFDWGTLGFYHAGATKYTFQSYGSSSNDEQYGYSFYPAVTYTANGVLMPIELEDNYIGYYNGENNISLLADYEATWFDIAVYSSLEFSISGDKSPANPWGEYNWYTDEGTLLLDSDPLEKKLVLTAGAGRTMDELGLPSLMLSLALEVGYIWNVLELVDTSVTDYTKIQYWSPSDENAAVFSVTLGGKYSIHY